MKIVVITTFFPNAADPLRAVFVRNLVRAMACREDVTVISPIARRPLRARSSRSLREVPDPGRDRQEGIEIFYPGFIAIPGLSFLNGLSIMIAVLPVLQALRRRGVADVVHAHCAYPDAVGAALAAGRVGVPLLVTAHGSDINVHARRLLLAPQIRWALRRASGVVGVSRALCERIARLVPDIQGSIRHIPCAGVDPTVFRLRSRIEVRQELELDREARIVIFIGQLVPIKGIEILLEAWRQLLSSRHLRDNDRLLLIGEGPLRGRLQRVANESGCAGTVRFLGGMQQSRVAGWISAANLLCLPSRNEGSPNVIVEAQACGVPVIASAVGGIPEMVVPRVNGLTCPVGDSVALAEAIADGLGTPWDASAIAAGASSRTWLSLADRNLELLAGIIQPRLQEVRS